MLETLQFNSTGFDLGGHKYLQIRSPWPFPSVLLFLVAVILNFVKHIFIGVFVGKGYSSSYARCS